MLENTDIYQVVIRGNERYRRELPVEVSVGLGTYTRFPFLILTKKHEMGKTCSSCGEEQKYVNKYHLEDRCVDGQIILKWILK